jgi:hypothetical protein
MKILPVELGHLHHVWPSVEPFIASALEHAGGDYSLASVKTLLSTGHWVLIVAVDEQRILGAATVHMFNRPDDRVAFITAIGGRLISNDDTFQQLKTLLFSFGATCIEGAARESIARLWKRYGFEEKYRIVGIKL